MNDLEINAKLLRLKGFLNEINHISYSYAQIGKIYPMNSMTNERALQLIKIYEELMVSVSNLILKYDQQSQSAT